jgi:hypothetical protein
MVTMDEPVTAPEGNSVETCPSAVSTVAALEERTVRQFTFTSLSVSPQASVTVRLTVYVPEVL